MEEVEENTNGSIDTGTDGDVGIPKVLDNMKHMNGQCVTGKPFDQCEVSIKDKNGTTSTQNGDCDISAQQVQKVQIKTDPVSISSQKDYGSEYSNSYKNDSNSVETDAVENNIKPVIPIAKVMAKARNSLKDLAAKVLSSPDRRPDSETSIADENEKEEDHNKVLHDSNGTEIDSKECKPNINDENTKTGVVAETGEELDLADVDKESRLEDDLLNPNLEEGIHMEIASDSEDFLLQLSPDQETDSCRIKKEVPAELNIKTVSDNDDKSINADHVKGRGVLNHDSSIANSTESVQSAETSDVLDKYNEGCVKKKETDSCKLNIIKHEKDVPQYSRSALDEVHDKTPLGENHRKDTHEMSAKVVEIDITPEKSPQKKDSRKDDEDDDDVIFEGESKVDLSTRYKEPAHKDPPVKDNSIDKSKTETEKSEQIQTPKTNENPITPHIIEDDDDVIFEKETKIDLSVQNICKENTNQLKSKENGYERKKEVPKTNENSEAVVNGTESKSKPICDKNETLNTSSPKSADNKSSIIERKRAAEESQLTSSDSKRSKLEPTCSTKEIVSPVEEPASIDIIDSDEDMDTTEHSPNSVPEKDTTGMLSEEKEDTKMITLSAEMLEALVRKKVKEYLAVQRDALLAQMSQKLQDFQSNNDLWKRQVKDLQVKVNDVTVLQQKHEKRKAHTAALRQITTRNVAVQVDDGRTGGTKIKSHVVTASQSSPLLTIPKAPPPGPGRIVTSPPGGTGTIRLPIPQSSIAPPIMTPMITHQPVTTDFKTPTVKSLLGTTRTQPTISSVAMTSPTSSAPIISTQYPRVVTTTTAAPTYISLPQVPVTSTSTKIITNPNGKAKIIDLTEDEPRLLVTTPQAVAPAGGTGVRTILSQGSQIVHAGFPNTSGTIQLVLASGSQPLKPGTIITGLPPNLIQSLPQTPVTGANLTSPNSSQTVVVTTVVTHPRPAAPPLLQSPTPVQSLVTGIPTAQVTGLASVPVSSRASAPVMGIASIPVTRLASAPVTNLASVPVKGQALAPVMGAGSVPVTSLAAVPVTALAPAKTISQTPALTSAPSTTTKVVGTSPGQLVILPNKHPAPFPLMNTLQKAELRSLPPKPSLRVSRVNQECLMGHKVRKVVQLYFVNTDQALQIKKDDDLKKYGTNHRSVECQTDNDHYGNIETADFNIDVKVNDDKEKEEEDSQMSFHANHGNVSGQADNGSAVKVETNVEFNMDGKVNDDDDDDCFQTDNKEEDEDEEEMKCQPYDLNITCKTGKADKIKSQKHYLINDSEEKDEDKYSNVNDDISVKSKALNVSTCSDDFLESESEMENEENGDDSDIDETFIPDMDDAESDSKISDIEDDELSKVVETSCSNGEVGDPCPVLNQKARKNIESAVTYKDEVKINKESTERDTNPILNKKAKRKYVRSIDRNENEVDTDGETTDEETIDEDSILRDVKNPKIFVRKILKSSVSKTGKAKKHSRVYNTYQYCSTCNKKVTNLPQHFERNTYIHNTNPKIKEIREETDKAKKKLLHTLLRAKFNHDNNMQTVKRGEGEILLERRPVREFRLRDYGPCPNCLLWFAVRLLRKHAKNCVNKKIGNLSNGDIMTQSDCLSGKLQSVASKKLVKKVFSKMQHDKVSDVVKGDLLITQLGNQWLEKKVGNILKRRVYTSQILRLVGRFLIILRKIKPIGEEADGSMWDYLKPCHFDALIKACILTASPLEVDDSLKAPSNALKIGHDLKRILSGKIGLAITQQDAASQDDAEKLLKLMNIYWETKVTKAARVILYERSYHAKRNLPKPEDIHRLSKYLKDLLSQFDYPVLNKTNYRQMAEAVQAKMVIYNCRRAGEVQAARLRDYNRRCSGTDGEHLFENCSEFMKKLLESQEVMTIRGKVGRGVPLIIPEDVRQGLGYMADPKVRAAVGISLSNEYLFASEGESIFWAHDSVRKAAEAAKVGNPEVVTSTSLRKYMATVTQVLDLKDSQMQWIVNHLTDMMDIYKLHYRAKTDILEKTQIAKILLLQEQGRLGNFRNKRLDDIDMADVVFEKQQEQETTAPKDRVLDLAEESANGLTSPDVVSEALTEAETFFGDELDSMPEKKAKKTQTSTTKTFWTQAEEEEIRVRFKSFFDAKVRPKPADCLRVIMDSRMENGLLRKRKRDVLKKKVFRMIDKVSIRVRWSKEEEAEIEKYFDLSAGKCPGVQDCLHAINSSKAAGGVLHQRSWENIKKKVCNMMKKRMTNIE